MGGDTFAVGCEYAKSIVFYDSLKENPDWNDSRYNTKYGVYSENCGLKNVRVSFGHDEYLYQVLKNNKKQLTLRYDFNIFNCVIGLGNTSFLQVVFLMIRKVV